MKIQKRLGTALAACLVVLGLTSCGGGGGSSSVDGTSIATSATVSATPATVVPTPTPTPVTGVVTNLNDSGAGSLRDAINSVNALPSSTSGVIQFSVAGTIVLASALPAINHLVQIQGTTAPGYTGPAPVVGINAAGN